MVRADDERQKPADRKGRSRRVFFRRHTAGRNECFFRQQSGGEGAGVFCFWTVPDRNTLFKCSDGWTGTVRSEGRDDGLNERGVPSVPGRNAETFSSDSTGPGQAFRRWRFLRGFDFPGRSDMRAERQGPRRRGRSAVCRERRKTEGRGASRSGRRQYLRVLKISAASEESLCGFSASGWQTVCSPLCPGDSSVTVFSVPEICSLLRKTIQLMFLQVQPCFYFLSCGKFFPRTAMIHGKEDVSSCAVAWGQPLPTS